MTVPAGPKRSAPLVMWILFWLPATLLLGLTPLVYWLAGVEEGTTPSSQAGAAAYSALIAAAIVLAAALLVRRARALWLMAYAAVALELSRRLGIEGDAVWTVYWGAAFAGWLALSAACLRRAT